MLNIMPTLSLCIEKDSASEKVFNRKKSMLIFLWNYSIRFEVLITQKTAFKNVCVYVVGVEWTPIRLAQC